MSGLNPFLMAADHAEVRCGPGNTRTAFLATGSSANFTLVEETSLKGETVPLHLHADDDESFYILDGEVLFYLGNETPQVAKAGTFVYIPGGTVHGFRVESDETKYLIFTTVRHGDFYRAISRDMGESGQNTAEVTDDDINRACDEYGISLVGMLPEDW